MSKKRVPSNPEPGGTRQYSLVPTSEMTKPPRPPRPKATNSDKE